MIHLICPTLNPEQANETIRQATRVAGIECKPLVVVDTEGHGFTKTVNQGLQYALDNDAEYVCILNDDVKVTQQDWLKRLVEALEERYYFGIAAAGGNCRTKPQSDCKPGLPKQIITEDQLAFFCVVIKREVLKEVGLLDENFIHYGSDSDYCMRVIHNNWECIYVQDVYVEHKVGELKKEWHKHDRQLFRNKWGF